MWNRTIMPRRLAFIAVALAVAVAFGAGCTTPSFPVPPPEPEAMSFNLSVETGTATFTADPRVDWAGAIVTVFDETSGHGVIVPAADDGSVPETPPFVAQDGDHVIVTYELPDQAASLCLILHDGRSSQDFRCQ